MLESSGDNMAVSTHVMKLNPSIKLREQKQSSEKIATKEQRELLKDTLRKAISNNANSSLSKHDLENHLHACNELLGHDSTLVDEYLASIFSTISNRKILLSFLRNEPKKIGLKYKIVLLWIRSIYMNELTKSEYWIFFDILREKNIYLRSVNQEILVAVR